MTKTLTLTKGDVIVTLANRGRLAVLRKGEPLMANKKTVRTFSDKAKAENFIQNQMTVSKLRRTAFAVVPVIE